MNELIKATLGTTVFDLVIKNVKLVNLFTKEIYTSEIGIKNGMVGHILQENEEPLEGSAYYDAKNKYALPGLIDTHIHIESCMMTPYNLSQAIVPHGTTSIACDPHEIGNVMGLRGVKYIIDASKDIPLNTFILAPSCVPSVNDLETAGSELYSEDVSKMLRWDEVIGLGEVMDYQGLLTGKTRIEEIVEVAKMKNVFIQGHAPSLTGRELSAYLCAGVESDHETSFSWEAKYKLRAGMTLECRDSSIVHDIPTLIPIIRDFGYPENTTFCTDDREPDDLKREGHMDHVIKEAIKAGGDPIEVIKMATHNAARLLRLRDRGVLAPGKMADIILLEDLKTFDIDEVFIEGDLVAKGGEMLVDIPQPVHEIESRNSVNISIALEEDTFKLESCGSKALVNVIAFNPNKHIVTERHEELLPVVDGHIDISGRDDLCTLAIIERHGRTDNVAVAFVKNFGLEKGAVASTVSHDSHNLVVVGKSVEDMLAAANEVIKVGGGIICVKDQSRFAGVDLPIAGLMSPKPIGELSDEIKKLKEGIISLGINTVSPIIQVAAFALPVIPEIRLTDKGLVDVLKQEIIPTIISTDKDINKGEK